MKLELGLTVSVGVGDNMLMAKMGSDYKKPDAVTVVTREFWHENIMKLPVGNLMYVGSSSVKKLNLIGITTIGELANADDKMMHSIFGKNGDMLLRYARGEDMSIVRHKDLERELKSIGNSTTTPRDLVNNDDVKVVLTVLAESVARRMREHNLKATTLSVVIRNKDLETVIRQCRLPSPTCVSNELITHAMSLFRANYTWAKPIRSLGLSVTDFEYDSVYQFDFSGSVERRERLERLDVSNLSIISKMSLRSMTMPYTFRLQPERRLP